MESTCKYSFYKILMDVTDKLRLPECFTRKFTNMIPKKAKLKMASGGTWEVRVETSEEEDGYFFTTGWAEFCGDMKLRLLDILLFSYVGNATFHVSAYAPNAFEKDSNLTQSQNIVIRVEPASSKEQESDSSSA